MFIAQCFKRQGGIVSLLLASLLPLLLQMGASERMLVLVRLPAVQQVDQSTLLQLLQTAVEKKLHVSVRSLCELPVLQAAPDSGQSNTAWSNLWSTAVNMKSPATLRALCQLPAACAAVRDVHALLPLLHAAVRDVQELLPLLHAAVRDVQALLPLLHAAVRCKDSGMLGCLCQLPAAADVSSDDAATLLHLAVENGSAAHVAALVQLQALQAFTFEPVLR
jgi:hypothetical protein